MYSTFSSALNTLKVFIPWNISTRALKTWGHLAVAACCAGSTFSACECRSACIDPRVHRVAVVCVAPRKELVIRCRIIMITRSGQLGHRVDPRGLQSTSSPCSWCCLWCSSREPSSSQSPPHSTRQTQCHMTFLGFGVKTQKRKRCTLYVTAQKLYYIPSPVPQTHSRSSWCGLLIQWRHEVTLLLTLPHLRPRSIRVNMRWKAFMLATKT